MSCAKKTSLRRIPFFLVFFLFAILGCQKDLKTIQPTRPQTTSNGFGHLTINPFSISNVTKARKIIAANKHAKAVAASSTSSQPVAIAPDTAQYPTFVYLKFVPDAITQQQFDALQNDSTIQMMGIPFADPAIYNDSTLDSTAIEGLKDGNIYVVSPAGDPIINTLMTATNLEAQVLDTLVQVPDTDTTLQSEALQLAGFRTELFGICLFKQPHGYVRYWDQQMNNGAGQYEPVRGMQVWSLVFGIPITTHTDGNGYYSIGWRYSIGTIMGTKAVNSRVKIMPFDVHGTVARNIYSIIAELLVGPLHIEGWVSPCTMRDGKDFNFSGHTQSRYWSQILNAYYFHDQYCQQENIHNAPSSMVTWACWTNTNFSVNGHPDFGNSVTPLAGHINLGAALTDYLTNTLFGANYNSASGFPTLLQLITGSILPDMIFNVPQAAEPQFYNSRLAQIAFHELGHASQYMQVGNGWYLVLADEIFSNHSVPNNPYGDGTYSAAGHVALAESWAEYIGTNYAIRRYPVGQKLGTSIPGFGLMTSLIENERYFYGGAWIPSGVYNDFADIYNPGEPWDNVAGASIRQMYNIFQPNITDFCGYANSFVSNYGSQFRASNIWQTFSAHNVTCGVSFFSSGPINQTYQRNNCAPGETGSLVPETVPAGMFTSLSSQLDADQQAQAYAQNLANTNGSCVAPSLPLNVTNTTTKSVQLTFTNLSSGTSYNFTVNPQGTLTGTIPIGTYNIFMTPAAYSSTYPIVYSLNGIIQTYYATVEFGSYAVNGSACNVVISPPPSITVNATNTTIKTMELTFTNLTTNLSYHFTVAAGSSLTATVPADNYNIFMTPDNYSASYPVIYTMNTSVQTYYALVEFGSVPVNSTVTINTSPPAAVPVNGVNSTSVGFVLTFTNLSTNYSYTFNLPPGSSTPGNVPAGNYNIFVAPNSYSASSPNVYTIYNSTQTYYATVEFGGVNVTGTCPISIHK